MSAEVFSGSHEVVLEVNLRTDQIRRRWEGTVPGFSQGIWCYPDGTGLLILGQNTSLRIDRNGESSVVGPENFHGDYCCVYTTAGVNKDKDIALNVDRGLRVYSEEREVTLWGETDFGFIQGFASIGSGWATIEASHKGTAANLRIFNPGRRGFDTEVMPLPTGFFWRITDYADYAIVWARESRVLYVVTENGISERRLAAEVPSGSVVPGSSKRSVFLVSSEGYTRIDVGESLL